MRTHCVDDFHDTLGEIPENNSKRFMEIRKSKSTMDPSLLIPMSELQEQEKPCNKDNLDFPNKFEFHDNRNNSSLRNIMLFSINEEDKDYVITQNLSKNNVEQLSLSELQPKNHQNVDGFYDYEAGEELSIVEEDLYNMENDEDISEKRNSTEEKVNEVQQ